MLIVPYQAIGLELCHKRQFRGLEHPVVCAMSEALVSGQTSEDLLADFESLLNAGSIDLSENHQIVIISTPSNVGLNSAVPSNTGEILLFATPQGPADVVQDQRRPTLGRPPVGS